MLFCDTFATGGGALEDLIVLTEALNQAGLPTRIPLSAWAESSDPNAIFGIAPFLAKGPAGPEDRLLLLGAHAPTEAGLCNLRRLVGAGTPPCVAAGSFPSEQARIGAQTRLSYVLGTDPILFEASAKGSLLSHPDAPIFGLDRTGDKPRSGKLRILLISPDLNRSGEARAIQTLGATGRMNVAVMTSAKAKGELQARQTVGTPIYSYNELSPATLAASCDVAVFYGPIGGGLRMRMLLAELAATGVGLFDASDGFRNRQSSPAFLPAPSDVAGLHPYLTAEIVPQLAEVRLHVRNSALAAQAADTVARLAGALGQAPETGRARRPAGAADAPARTVFVPTNGVGLGHAQRCSLIASALDHSRAEPVFAAFPSCTFMLKSYGFDVMPLIPKSPAHKDALANDVVNYLRLRRLGAGVDSLVFDGGYVFTSIYRAILDNDLRSVWVRRGLWQPGQNNAVALDREKVFDRVIVPLEAFEELNETTPLGPSVRQVGPIVQTFARDAAAHVALRARIAAHVSRPAERLVVTMLGGGVAADRRAQTQAICAMLARRPDTLHLVVVWPTAAVHPGWFAWPNTRVVKTHHASALVAAADLYISAAGYNSFHEAIYNAVPTIFMPQMAAYMDDQRARAAAAVDRGLAAMVEPHQFMTLDASIANMLDRGRAEEIRARLRGCDLPATGAADAARLIEEVTLGSAAPAKRSAELRVA